MGEVLEVRDGDDSRICVLTHLRGRNGLGGRKPDGESRANANLIVAAPEMYEALKAYDDLDAQRLVCEECRDTPEIAAEACATCFPFADRARLLMRAAIAKAEGR
jgi:hypothetical protein